MRTDIELLGKDLPVATTLVEHDNEVGVLKDVLNLRRRQQILGILSDSSGDLKCD